MTRAEIKKKVTEVFHNVFEDENIDLTDQTTANDIKGWDSLTHITLLSEIESVFGMKFTMKQVLGMKNVGEMFDILEKLQ